MTDYYTEQLSSNNLKRCYDIAPPRVNQYFEAEMNYVLEHLEKPDTVIELGCGYGRVLKQLDTHSSNVIGIDTSSESLMLAAAYLIDSPRIHLVQSTAEFIALPSQSVDKVVCIQNGISAFKIDPKHLIRESVRITRKGGKCLFSSYSDKFWEPRLEWFKMQADEDLLGEIDWEKTSDGVIVCKDGFTATTFRPEDFANLTSQLNLQAEVIEIDESSVFCVISV
ncbi:MAG: class I SAM-dependent methyltransferase [Candidatus Thorarchaeota archaeon]